LIEDNCDALGSRYNGQLTGTFGHLATSSFYPAHHITTAEGGAVYTNDPLLFKTAKSFRDWGRDCWCPTGKDNTCGKRFDWKLGNLPHGYDHKYIYSEMGYNLKMTDIQAAIGCAQMDKLEEFTRIRKRNFRLLHEGLKQFEDKMILPQATDNSEPSWFGFLITLKGNQDRRKIINFLNSNGIATRLLFAGNITKQPSFTENKVPYRVIGSLHNTDVIMNQTFWIGVYSKITEEKIRYVVDKFKEFWEK
jgi:CDP-6-deoxy-D-xylo-4-hexulose-3-dehydrase